MRTLTAVIVVVSCCMIPTFGAQGQKSAYAGQEARDVKALSPEEVDAYISGKGFGMAKAAELNGYAGPAHVLELAQQLELTPDQRAKTQALFESMQSHAIAQGRQLIDKERALDQMFATKTIDGPKLTAALDEIGTLQARVRRTHLEAHLTETQILTPAQNALYAKLRGYSAGAAGVEHHYHMQ